MREIRTYGSEGVRSQSDFLTPILSICVQAELIAASNDRQLIVRSVRPVPQKWWLQNAADCCDPVPPVQ